MYTRLSDILFKEFGGMIMRKTAFGMLFYYIGELKDKFKNQKNGDQ